MHIGKEAIIFQFYVDMRTLCFLACYGSVRQNGNLGEVEITRVTAILEHFFEYFYVHFMVFF